MLKKTVIEPLVIEAIRELVSNEAFAKEVKSRIGTQIDTVTIDREIKNYADKLREVDLNKARLENEIDTLPEDTRYRERKLHDMTIRLDGLYDIIVELEEKIEDAKLKRRSVELNAITLDNVYKLMINFDKMYDRISDKERKALVSSLIKEIQIYTHAEADVPL
jgi:site-specific DNA recombinase